MSAFGFTEGEVGDFLDRAGLAARRGEVQRWYNDYVFGRTVVYNPCSVLSVVANAPYDMAPQPCACRRRRPAERLTRARAGRR